MSAIFVSHASQDGEIAAEVARRLERDAQHSSIFLDFDPEKGIVAGQSWERTLYRKLRACEAVLALCTDSYLKSHWCFAEIALARMEGKHIVALLADPLSGDFKLPAILTDTQWIDLRTDPDAGYQKLWKSLREEQILGVEGDWDPHQCPYLGLDTFQEEHAPIFFGRETETRKGIELLARGAPGLVMVMGSSGSGKSSLVRAGMLPKLRRDKARWLVVDPFRPGADPFAELATSLEAAFRRHASSQGEKLGPRGTVQARLIASAEALVAADAVPPGSEAAIPPVRESVPGSTASLGDARLRRLLDQLKELQEEPPPNAGPRLRDFLDWSLADLQRIGEGLSPRQEPIPDQTELARLTDLLRRASHDRRDARVLLVIDQFEELLGYDAEDHPANHFLALLRASLESDHCPFMVLATMRSDFLPSFQENRELVGYREFANLPVGPMSLDGLRRVIEKPAERGQVTLETGLTDLLLEDAKTADALPLLSFTLWKLWGDYAEDHRLDVEDYRRLGGLERAVAEEADRVLEPVSRQGREDEVRVAFLRMARVTEDGRHARRTAAWDDPALQPVHDVLERFVSRRLLRVRDEGGTRVVEVAHEVLFRSWGPLKGWLQRHEAELLLAAQVRRDAETWERRGRAPDILWPGGGRLQQAAELARTDALQPSELAFVRAGMEQQRRRVRRRVQMTAAVMATLAGAAGFAYAQKLQAESERSRALDLARVAVAHERLVEDPTLAALVLLEVEEPETTNFWSERAREAINRGVSAALPSTGAALTAATFSPDGRLVALGDVRGTVVVSAADGRGSGTVLDAHEGAVTSVAFSPDGGRLVTGSREGTARLWDLASTSVLAVLPSDGGEVLDVDFSPDGASVLIASKEVRVFRVDEPDDPVVFAEHAPDVVWSAEFSPDGRRIVSAAEDRTARIWNADGSGEVVVLEGHAQRLTGAVFSPDGRWVATTAYDSTAAVWSSDGSGEPLVLRGHAEVVTSVAFSPDGLQVATSSRDSTARVWRIDEGASTAVLEGHLGEVVSVSFSNDGKHLLTASRDGTARLWNATGLGEPRVLDGRDGDVVTAAFSPDATRILTVSRGGSARGWHPLGRSDPELLTTPLPDRLEAAAFSEDGADVALVTLDPDEDLRTLRVLSIGDRTVRRSIELVEQYDTVLAVSFSPDRTSVVTRDSEGWTSVVATTSDTGEPIPVSGGALMSAATHSPDGESLAFATRDGSLRIASLADVDSARTVGTHANTSALVFTEDGSRLASLARDGSVKLWSADGGRALVVKDSTGTPVRGGAFSARGELLLTFAAGVAYLWDGTDGAPLAELRGHTDDIFHGVFDESGDRVATSSADGTVRLWRIDGAGDPVVLRDGEGPMRAARFEADGASVLTVSGDGTIRRWTTTSHAELGRHLRASTNRCLEPGFRTVQLGQDAEAALDRYRECEAAHGRPGR